MSPGAFIATQSNGRGCGGYAVAAGGVSGLLLALLCGNTAMPALSSDDYHYGEALLGWWALLDFGKLPYWDYVPPRGLLADDLPGIVGRLFYDGTAASFPEARRITQALLSLLAFLAIRWRTKSLVVGVCFDRFVRGLRMDNSFGCCWFRSAASCLSRKCPGRGRPFGLFAEFSLSLECLRREWCCWQPLLPPCFTLRGPSEAASGSAGCSRYSPGRWWLRPSGLTVVWYGAVRYVLENSAVNQVAWGIPWNLSWEGGSRNAGLVFEFVRVPGWRLHCWPRV